ncbi:hypothetical protein FA15DRAFT_671000 [Coprinopsis marcescibilis]|uniref:Uncharacterized protein n=1 Tax=Coprinopsis marcescibilis TaxID=230819 RepID=A0A5C3KR76_COPMA|nr:hypothetical protein FA15DRAFT_671000 [Coprinopsis marcescibilis]
MSIIRERRSSYPSLDIEACPDPDLSKDSDSPNRPDSTSSMSISMLKLLLSLNCFSKLTKTATLVSQFLIDRIKLKITLWRFLNTGVIATFGIWKTICAYSDNGEVNAWDMALGLLWAVISYWGNLTEAEYPEACPALFQKDVKTVLVRPCLTWLIILATAMPIYISGYMALTTCAYTNDIQ